MKGNPRLAPVNSFSPLGVQKTEFGAASQTLLTGVRLPLPRRLGLIGHFSSCWEVWQWLSPRVARSCSFICSFFYVLFFYLATEDKAKSPWSSRVTWKSDQSWRVNNTGSDKHKQNTRWGNKSVQAVLVFIVNNYSTNARWISDDRWPTRCVAPSWL